MEFNQIYNTDALEGLKQLDENSIDAIISDPPYSLSFMNKEWDTDLPSVEILKECLRVLKTGAWALWLMTPRQDSQLEFLLRLRQAGFNISYGSLEWLYLSGFPKAADLSLLADKRACREELIQKLGREPTKDEFKEAWSKWREVVGKRTDGRYAYSFQKENAPFVVMNKEKGIIANTESIGVETNPHTQEAQALSGSYAGMQLKPSRELIIVSQKPIAGKTYLDQALLHLKEPKHNQLGGTWLDDCRVPYKNDKWMEAHYPHKTQGYNASSYKIDYQRESMSNPTGRFPANIIVSDNALDIGIKTISSSYRPPDKGGTGNSLLFAHKEGGIRGYNDSGDLSRYFDLDFWFENKLKELPEEQQKIFPFLYVPKASKSERNKGLEHLPEKNQDIVSNQTNKETADKFGAERKAKMQNIHPTAKPIKLMSYALAL